MDIVLLTCTSGQLFQRSIGAYQLANHIRNNGYTVQVIDFTDYFSTDELINTLNNFVNEETLCLGISTTFYSNSNENFLDSDRNYQLFLPQNILETISWVKKNYTNIKIISGGAKANNSYNSLFDKIFYGYAENDLILYLNSLKKVEIAYRPFNIEDLKHRFINNDCITQKEVLPIEISRGCIFKCKFCAYPLNGKKKNDYLRNAINIADEMKYNYENFGTTNYFFVDDTFNDNNYKLESLHNEISKLPFKINFTCYLRIDLMYRFQNQISILKDMGLATPFFGIESLNQKTCNVIGKGLNVEIVKDFLCELYYKHWESKIPFFLSFIIGLPFENKQTIENTVEWIKKYDFTCSFQPLSLLSNSIYKSEFEMNYENYGYKINKETKKWYNDTFTEDDAINLANFYNEQLIFKNSLPSSWFFMSLLNHGYTVNELYNTSINDLNWFKIKLEKFKRIKNYKKLLNSTNFRQ